ncbi:hypothetical protein Tco_1298449, partial [Tanacetum coccineum]
MVLRLCGTNMFGSPNVFPGMGLSTLWSFSRIGIMDYSMGTTSSFFRSCACDHPVVITMSDWVGFGEVGWGGFGFHIWDGVIRECRVEKSNVPVLTHRICRVRWFFLSLRDSQSFLYFVYDLTWVVSSIPLGSGGIRGVRLCSDKRRLSRLPLVDSGFVRISPWEGCKPGLDVSLWIGLGILGCTPRLFGFWVSRIFGKGLGSVWHDSAIFSLGWGYVRISSTGFWLCNIIFIIDKDFRMFGIDYGLSGYIASGNCNKMLMKYKDFCLKIGPSLQNAEELQVIFFCWIECMVQLVI